MKIIAMIPARYRASRFPGKLMKTLNGKTVILQTYQNVVATDLFDDVIVVTDSQIICDHLMQHNAKVMMSKKEHDCGSDRIAEAVEDIEADIVINVQGDEPFTSREPLQALIEVFKNDSREEIDLASLMFELEDEEEIQNPNNVKVVVDNQNFAMYFSRSPIPYKRDKDFIAPVYKHIGIYAFRKQALLDFASWDMTTNESVEKIEAIRYLEHGKKMKMLVSLEKPVGIDTPDDLEKAKSIFEKK